MNDLNLPYDAADRIASELGELFPDTTVDLEAAAEKIIARLEHQTLSDYAEASTREWHEWCERNN